MNILDIVILVLLAYGLFSGMYKGFLTSLLSLIGFVASWFGAQALYEKLANLALSNTTLMAVLNQYLEPDTFFDSFAQANTSVHELVAGGESAISAAIASVSEKFSFIAEAFSANIRSEAFANLGITTLVDYFNQTLWVAVFNVVAFIVTFAALYIVISLVVNLLDKTICFPILRGVDWLIGGLLGLAKASVVVVLILAILPTLTNMVAPELTAAVFDSSQLYDTVKQIDFLSVFKQIQLLVLS